jgi:methyltransferase (TIGR00027 family)
VETLTASRTALSTALMRAAHGRLDPNPLLDDPWGDRLVPDSAREALYQSALDRMDEAGRAQAVGRRDAVVDAVLQKSPAYANVILRSRYTEDALKRAVEHGVRQYVLIGAGFDSFALRRPDFSKPLQIFEIDHPATQALKLQRIADCGITLPASVHFIAADLSQKSVAEALSGSAYQRDIKSFFSWLGVTMYLTREANLATLGSIASCAPAGSELAFTYMEARVLLEQSEAFKAIQARVTAMGEPFLSGFDPATLSQQLRDCGLELLEDVDGETAARNYSHSGGRRFDQHSASHLALARVSRPADLTPARASNDDCAL